MEKLILSRAQARAVDRVATEDYGVPGILLMENAGRGAAELLLEESPLERVVILCGHGNNGGDGFVIARHLENRGVLVEVLLFADPHSLQGDAAINYRIIKSAGTPIRVLNLPNDIDQLIDSLQSTNWIVDALLGTGAQGTAREPYLSVIEVVNGIGHPVLSVDLPSGFDCDLGPVEDATIQATMTATFIARKRGMQVADAESYTGKLSVIDIGMPRVVLTRLAEQ